jgi:hypothetical protein
MRGGIAHAGSRTRLWREAIGPIRISGSFEKDVRGLSAKGTPWTITPTRTRTSINDLQGRGYVLDPQDYRS